MSKTSDVGKHSNDPEETWDILPNSIRSYELIKDLTMSVTVAMRSSCSGTNMNHSDFESVRMSDDVTENPRNGVPLQG